MVNQECKLNEDGNLNVTSLIPTAVSFSSKYKGYEIMKLKNLFKKKERKYECIIISQVLLETTFQNMKKI